MKKINQISPYLGNEEKEQLLEVIDSKWLSEGPKTNQLKEDFSNLLGRKHVTFAPNGTLALFLALKSLGIQEGDEVIVPSFTFYASASSVVLAGANPIFADVNLDDYQIDFDSASKLISKKTKAIMPVCIYGNTVCPCDVERFARQFNLKVIQDAAQSIGVMTPRGHAGITSDISTFSLFIDKTITTGEGGVIAYDDDEIHENLIYMRNQGRIDRGSFIHPMMGWNFRISELNSALGLAQIKKLPIIIQRKRENHSKYLKYLEGVGDTRPLLQNNCSKMVPFRFAFLSKFKDKIMKALVDSNIETRTFFYPMHMQPYFKANKHASLKNSETLYDEGVALPIHLDLKKEDIISICSVIKSVF